ncbi:hypothetical protein IEQ34_011492 [Dendrobium chrysotoxum]|uniref:Cytochrome P450 n=1 Tax=Dendrobium chrysotoxum TaxID=161865 RepID=A0AAV7GSC9_DENCH|nr:hypothetical protein IEQ34_011492 [Dendrobium chrysotoxum]
METSEYFSILLALLFVLLLLLKTLKSQRKIRAGYNLPPGPPKLPIIGNMHNLRSEHPHRRLAALAKTYGPIFHLKLSELNVIVVTSPALAAEVTRTHDLNFASRPQFLGTKVIFYDGGYIVFAPYGKLWTQLRRIVTVELFSHKRVKNFVLMMEEEGHSMVEKIKNMAINGSPVNITNLLLSIANTTVSRAAFGKDCAQNERLFTAVKKTFKYMSGFDLPDLYPSLTVLADISGMRRKLERVRRELDGTLNEIFEEHMERAKRKDKDANYIVHDVLDDEDLVDVLLRLKTSGELEDFITMDNIKAVILDLILGGTETTSAIMEWAMTDLVRHPEIMRKAQEEVRKALNGKRKIEEKDISNLPYLNMIIKETLRMRPPAPFLVPRHSLETVKLGGYTVPAGSRVIIDAWAIMRDNTCWDDADSFKPERFEGVDMADVRDSFIPFGGGRRVCPGINFGMRSMENVLANLLYHFDWKLPGGKRPEEVDVEEAFGLSLVRKNDLVLVATPYKYI